MSLVTDQFKRSMLTLAMMFLFQTRLFNWHFIAQRVVFVSGNLFKALLCYFEIDQPKVQVKNGGSLEVNGAHAGKTGHTQAKWTDGSAGGAGGIVHILASGVLLSSGSISLKPGNSTGCENFDKASPGFLSIRGLLDTSFKYYVTQSNAMIFWNTNALSQKQNRMTLSRRRWLEP